MAIRIAHEAPKSAFQEVEKLTDYDYALVHLFEEDPEYLQLFKTSLEQGREVILDNSIFELEEAFDADKFAGWIEELRPTWYVIPDALEDMEKTISQAENWIDKYSTLPGKKIGVVQGKTYEEIMGCYAYLDKVANVDMIAISFDYSLYTKLFPHPNKLVSWTLGRAKLLGDLWKSQAINTNKPHHLLGSALPFEGKFYGGYDWIYSMDTSNPCVHALRGITYQPNFGLYSKDSQKLFTMINHEVSDKELQDIKYNIKEFRNYWNVDRFETLYP